MADEKKSRWEDMKSGAKEVLGMSGESQKKDADNKPYAPAIPAKTYEKKPDAKTPPPDAKKAQPSTFKRGGKVKKTGMAKVHKGEKVLTVRETKKLGSKKKAAGRKRA